MDKRIYDIALDTLKKSAPGLSDTTRQAIARSISLKATHLAGSGADGKVKGERPPNRPGSDKPCFFVGSTGYDAECKTCGQYTPDYERQDFECPWLDGRRTKDVPP